MIGRAQAKPQVAEEEDDLVALASSLGPAGIVPVQRGLNASLISSSQHDSVNGWSEIVTPSLAFRFSRQFSADVATPYFVYLLTDRTKSVKGKPVTSLGVRRDVLSDTVIAAHWTPSAFSAGRLGDVAASQTVSLVAPTGSVQDGVGAGRVAYNVTSHAESSLPLSPYLDLGAGTSSRLQNRRVQKTQTSTGLLANFAAGVTFPLRAQFGLSVEVYEQLPLGDQTVYQSTVNRKGRTVQRAVGKGLAEDNGFNSSLDVPIDPHISLSGFYSRSLRQHEDTTGFSITYLVRGRPGEGRAP